MSTPITLNGVGYTIPAVGDRAWGTSLSSYLVALSTGVLSKAGGSFTLTADADFGSNFGLKSLYFKSRGTASTTGVFRLGNTESIGWRNAANSGDKVLKVNSSDQLEFDGTPITPFAALTANRAIVTNGSGIPSAATTTSTEIGYVNGVTSAIQTQFGTATTAINTKLTSPITTTGDIIYSSSGTTAARLAVGDGSQLLGVSGGVPAWKNSLTGNSDIVQFRILGSSPQTADIFNIQKSDATNLISVTNVNGTKIRGTTTNDAAATGFVGEIVTSQISTLTNQTGGSGGYMALTSISLTAGDWDISALGSVYRNGATYTAAGESFLAIGLTSASISGATYGYDYVSKYVGNISQDVNLSTSIPKKTLSLSATTTVYLNTAVNFSAGTPQWRGSITARRVR